MAKIKAYLADHDDIAKTFIDTLEAVGVVAVCLGTAPLLMWLSTF